MYPQYLAMIKAVTENTEDIGFKRFIKASSEIQRDDKVELIVKVYPQAKHGISTQLDSMKEGAKYFIDGQVGKGLELGAESVGNHVFFCGGTGILPFLDTFAVMLRKAVNDFSPDKAYFENEDFSMVNNEFKVSIYAYFTKRTEATGLEILEGIQKLQKVAKKEFNIKVNITFTREGGSRLTKDSAMEILKAENEASPIQRIFVCGPAPQNIMFNELTPKIVEEFGIDRWKIDVL